MAKTNVTLPINNKDIFEALAEIALDAEKHEMVDNPSKDFDQEFIAEVRDERGGEENNIWNLQYTKEKEDEEKARLASQKAEELKRKEA